MLVFALASALLARSTLAATCPVQEIGLNAGADAALSASDCRVTDIDPAGSDTYANQFRVTVADAGVLTARMTSSAFNTVLLIYRADGRLLAQNDDADGSSNSRVTINLNPGKYTIVATSKTAGAGAYHLATTFEAPRSCGLTDLPAGQDVSGSLGPGACRTVDLRALSVDDRPLNRYRFKLERQAILSIEMTSADFDTYLELYNSQGTRLTRDHAGAGPNHSRVVVNAVPDTYTVYAYSFRVAAGTYTVKALVEAPRVCPVKTLQAGDSIAGAFSAESCRVLDLRAPSADATYVDLYKISVPARSVVSVEMQSRAFDTFLVLADPQYEALFDNDDVADDTTNSGITGSVEPGTYIVIANSIEVATGSYTASLRVEDLRSCPAKDLASGASVAATLTPQSCRVLDLRVPSADETPVDVYRIALAKRSVLTLGMRSTAFDPYLFLTDPQYEPVFGSDFADSGGNVAITGSLEAGTYYVLANSSDKSTGAYTATAKIEDLRSCPSRELGRNDSVAGQLAATSCRVLDLIVPSQDPTELDPYRIAIDAAGVLSLTLGSKDFHPYLFLVDEQYRSKYELDSFGIAPEIGVNLLVTPGTYYVLANTDDNVGAYTLKTRFAPPRDCPELSIELQDSQPGKLAPGGCTFQDIVPFTDIPAPANRHPITLPQRGDLTVKVSSGDFAPAILIADANYVYDVGDDLNARGASTAEATATLPAGHYHILVIDTDGAGGSYTISTSFARSSAGAPSRNKPLRAALLKKKPQRTPPKEAKHPFL